MRNAGIVDLYYSTHITIYSQREHIQTYIQLTEFIQDIQDLIRV